MGTVRSLAIQIANDKVEVTAINVLTYHTAGYNVTIFTP